MSLPNSYRMLKKHLKIMQYEDELSMLERAEQAGVPPPLLRELAVLLIAKKRAEAAVLLGLLASEEADPYELEALSAFVCALKGAVEQLVLAAWAARQLKPATLRAVGQGLKGSEKEVLNRIEALAQAWGCRTPTDAGCLGLTGTLRALSALTDYLSGKQDAESLLKRLDGYTSKAEALKEALLARIPE